MHFTGAVLVNTQQPLQYVDKIEVPKLRKGQVLVKILYAGMCHSQIMEQQGLRGTDKYLPHLLGHEGTAEVIDTGPEISKVKIVDTVILGWLKGEGIDSGGCVYSSPIGIINSGAVTTLSEYSVVSENRCYLLPENISVKEGVLLGCALPTGMGLVTNQVKPTPNTTMAVVGLGGIGMSAVMAANCYHPNLLVAVDTKVDKLQEALKLGATHIINPLEEDVQQRVIELTNGHMLDYAVEAAGSCKTIELAFSLIHKQHGECIFASHPAAGEKIQIDPFELICGKKITGSWGGCSHPEHMTQFTSDNKAKLSLDSFMSHNYTFSQINQAMEDLQEQKILRAIIKIAK